MIDSLEREGEACASCFIIAKGGDGCAVKHVLHFITSFIVESFLLFVNILIVLPINSRSQ